MIIDLQRICHFDRSEAQWRNLLFCIRRLQKAGFSAPVANSATSGRNDNSEEEL
jgi:hypothetical protein